jgi:hypothetical protein
MVQLKQKLIMLGINNIIYVFVICLPVFAQGANLLPAKGPEIVNNVPMPTVRPYKEKLKKWGGDVKGGITGTTTKVMDLYHDAGAKATELKNNIKDTIEHEIDYIHKEIVPTIVGIPYYYYGGALLFYYASRHDFWNNVQTVGGVVFIVALSGHFIQWSMHTYMKIQDKNLKEKDSAKGY